MVWSMYEEELFIERLINSQIQIWNQLTQSQKMIIMREFEAKERHKKVSRDLRYRLFWKPEIDFQVVSEMMMYCDVKGFRMNDRRWILLPKFELDKQKVRSSNSLLSGLKEVTNGTTRANWKPDSVDVIDSEAGFRVLTIVKQNLCYGRVEWNTDENPKWERLSP